MSAVERVKDERLHVRCTSEEKQLIEQAAMLSLEGDLTTFVIKASVESAHRVMAEHEVTVITAENRKRFYRLLLDPPPPGRALRALFNARNDRFELVP